MKHTPRVLLREAYLEDDDNVKTQGCMLCFELVVIGVFLELADAGLLGGIAALAAAAAASGH